MTQVARIALGMALLGLWVGAAAGQPSLDTPALALPAPGPPVDACAPPQLFRAVIRNISPGVPAAARAAQPRVLYRKGAIFMRSEEEVDPVSGDQMVVIVAEPDVWMINLADRTGRHTLDPGPELVVRAPILPPGQVPPQLLKLEFGCEPEFIAEFAPEPERVLPWGSEKAALHRVSVGEHSVALLMLERRNRPLMVSYLRQGRPVVVYRYDDYRHGLPDRPQLFAPDRNIRITKIAPGEGAPPSGEAR